MGWTFFHVERGARTDAILKREFTSVEILDSATVGSTWYAAVKLPDSDHIIAAVVLTSRHSREYHNFGYKDMDEMMGPVQAQCPKRIMKLLSPLDDTIDPHGYGRDWRERVNKYHANKSKSNGLEDGTLVRLTEPVNLTNGMTVQYLKVLFSKDWGKKRRTRKLLVSDAYGRVSTVPTRVVNFLNRRSYEVVEPQELTKEIFMAEISGTS